MKIGVVGKGGVGKTTVSALLARAYAQRGGRVIAVDTDSNPNLGLSLGLSAEETDAVPVLPRRLVVGERADVSAAELVARYGRASPAGPLLLSALRVDEAAAGCACGGHATVRSFLGEVLADQADVTVVDMEAGIEHLSRSGGTLAHADALLVVMEPSRKSVLTAVRTKALAEDLGIPRIYGVGNKARSPEDRSFLEEATARHGLELAGVLPFDEGVAEADRAGGVVTLDVRSREEIERVIAFVDRELSGAPAPQPAS
jgi:CO dehydrogenase maturation factor